MFMGVFLSNAQWIASAEGWVEWSGVEWSDLGAYFGIEVFAGWRLVRIEGVMWLYF